jgi:hypothetical protein
MAVSDPALPVRQTTKPRSGPPKLSSSDDALLTAPLARGRVEHQFAWLLETGRPRAPAATALRPAARAALASLRAPGCCGKNRMRPAEAKLARRNNPPKVS